MADYGALAEELLDHMRENSKLDYHRGAIDFSHGEMSILAHLCYKQDGVCPGTLCSVLGMTTPRVSAALAGLCRKSLIKRRGDPGDRRRIHIYITDKGRAYIDTRHRRLTDDIAVMLRSLGEDDAREYVRIVGRISSLSNT